MTKRDHQCHDGRGRARAPDPPNRDYAKRRKLNYGGGYGGRGGKENDTDRSPPSGPPPTILDGQVVPKLDQSDSVQARRIQQRRRMVMYGKNTVGYDEYVRQVPKHRRKPRNMDHPTTPDHTADIPNRRWQGLLKAWRKALHKYDPPDLQTADAKKGKETEGEARDAKPSAAREAEKEKKASVQSVQAKQIAEATSKGMLVDFAASAEQSSDSPAAASAAAALVSSPGKESFDEEEERYQRMIQQAEEEGTDDLVKVGKTTAARSDDFLLEDDSDDDLL